MVLVSGEHDSGRNNCSGCSLLGMSTLTYSSRKRRPSIGYSVRDTYFHRPYAQKSSYGKTLTRSEYVAPFECYFSR